MRLATLLLWCIVLLGQDYNRVPRMEGYEARRIETVEMETDE